MNDDDIAEKVKQAMTFKYGEETARAAADIAAQFAVVIGMKADACRVRPMDLMCCAVDTIIAMLRDAGKKRRQQSEERRKN